MEHCWDTWRKPGIERVIFSETRWENLRAVRMHMILLSPVQHSRTWSMRLKPCPLLED
jgi:hypothetical protein